MQKLLLTALGWMLARTPELCLRGLSALLGDAIFFLMPRRRQIVLSNLSHAFPERPAEWRCRLGRASCRRMIETALFSLATPFLSEARMRAILGAAPGFMEAFARHQAEPRATLFCSPHIAYWEAQTSMSLLLPSPFPEFGTIYRPLDNPAADALVKRSRERFGMRLLSRKEGFQEALRILRRNGIVGILFDQNAGLHGALTTLLGRVCSTTELPGLMAEKFGARVYGIYPRRLGFWRVELNAELATTETDGAGVTIALNRWLEDLLTRDENVCASWLWAHNRWRNQDIPGKRLRLEAKRNLLGTELAARAATALPRRTRIWVRLPNWLGDVVMALPLLRAMRASRPDAEITLIGKPALLPLISGWGVADRTLPLPSRGFAYFLHFWRQRHAYPDAYLLFTNSLRGDLEAWLSRCRQRFGIIRPGKHRPLLTHAYRVPADFDERNHHQLELWTRFLDHFGLAAQPDLTPVRPTICNQPAPIGLIAGSENYPAKRWPVEYWRALIAALPNHSFVLFGPAKDISITQAIANDFPGERVANLAGNTDLPGFAARLCDCALIVSNDTGGMHLANALGVPLIALFGPTNPVRTGPVFKAPLRILQPPDCEATGGAPLSSLQPAAVLTAIRETLGQPAA